MNLFDLAGHDPVRDLVLAAGEVNDLSAMQEWLRELPADAYGQVFVESDAEIDALSAPVGVSVQRVPVFFEPGVALAAAVEAWLNEWVWVDAEADRTLQLWTGAYETEAVTQCRDRIQRSVVRREPSVAQAVNLIG